MIIKLENKEYNMIESLGELTIQEFIDIRKLKELYDNGEFTDVEYITEFASCLTGIETDDVMKLDISSFNLLYNEVLQISKQNFNDFKLIENLVEIDGNKYMFDTKLDIIPLGQWFDINELLKKNDFWANAPKFFAMLIRPIDQKTGKIIKYDIQEIEGRVNLFQNKLKLKHFFPVYAFFLIFWSELQK